MAHAHHKFTDAQKAAGNKDKKSPVADYVVKLIGKLYKSEAEAIYQTGDSYSDQAQRLSAGDLS